MNYTTKISQVEHWYSVVGTYTHDVVPGDLSFNLPQTDVVTTIMSQGLWSRFVESRLEEQSVLIMVTKSRKELLFSCLILIIDFKRQTSTTVSENFYQVKRRTQTWSWYDQSNDIGTSWQTSVLFTTEVKIRKTNPNRNRFLIKISTKWSNLEYLHVEVRCHPTVRCGIVLQIVTFITFTIQPFRLLGVLDYVNTTFTFNNVGEIVTV